MTPPLPEPLMLDGEPHYTALQIAEMRLPGMPGTRRRVNARALSESWPFPPPLGSRRRKVYPLEALPREAEAEIRRPAQPKPRQPAPADSASTQNKPNDKKRLFLGLGPDQRVMVDAKAEAVVLLWRHYKRRLPGEISIPDAGKAFCALWKAGHAGAEERAYKALPAFAVSSLYRWDKALETGRSDRTGRPARSGGRTQHPRDVHRDARGVARHTGRLSACQRDPPRARVGGAKSLLSAPPPGRPHHPALDEKMEGGEPVAVGTPKRFGRPGGLHALSADFSKDISMEKGRES